MKVALRTIQKERGIDPPEASQPTLRSADDGEAGERTAGAVGNAVLARTLHGANAGENALARQVRFPVAFAGDCRLCVTRAER
eukprot:COSAG05_NODE_668_length_8004_cov_3.894371_3_plen_83_part_00